MFKSFYELLEESLKGKKVKLRSYPGDVGEYEYSDHKILYWSNELEYCEWTGVVKSILQNDNSHVDIIFDKTQPHTYPEGCLQDCYNWHMCEYLEIIND